MYLYIRILSLYVILKRWLLQNSTSESFFEVQNLIFIKSEKYCIADNSHITFPLQNVTFGFLQQILSKVVTICIFGKKLLSSSNYIFHDQMFSCKSLASSIHNISKSYFGLSRILLILTFLILCLDYTFHIISNIIRNTMLL